MDFNLIVVMGVVMDNNKQLEGWVAGHMAYWLGRCGRRHACCSLLCPRCPRRDYWL